MSVRMLRSNFMWNGRAFSGLAYASASLARRSQRRLGVTRSTCAALERQAKCTSMEHVIVG